MPSLKHAVILGGSVAGLLAAAAVSQFFEQVTIVDRDALLLDGPDADQPRLGVPQSTQVHHLLTVGADLMEQLVPGLAADLLDLGCERYDDAADFCQYSAGAWRMRVRSDLIVTTFRRPVFELAIRRRVLGLSNVHAVRGTANGLLASEDGSRVVGARLANSAQDVLTGDLVVDATGRGSRAPHWLEELGYSRPEEQRMNVHMGYSKFSATFPPDVLPAGLAGLSVASTSSQPQGVAIRPCGNGGHEVVAYGMVKNYPPTDVESIIGFCAGLASPLVAELIRKATVTSEVFPYRMASNRRRLWEKVDRRPDGFVILGDAVTSFNPVYGQGMTMAAIGATALQGALADSDDVVGVAAATSAGIAPWADIAFTLAVSADSIYPGVEYINLQPPPARDPQWSRAFRAAQSAEREVLLAAKRSILFMDQSALTDGHVQEIVSRWRDAELGPPVSLTDPLTPPGISV